MQHEIDSDDETEIDDTEPAIWRRLVTNMVARGRGVAEAMAAADALVQARRVRILQGHICLARTRPSSGVASCRA
jgi:hypothetical protein